MSKRRSNMQGWIRIERAVFDHDFFDDEPMSSREAWIWLVANAAWRDTTHKIWSKQVVVPRGSIVTTLRDLSKSFGWKSDKRVRGFLARLEEEEMASIKIVGERKASRTLIEIHNYDEYQSSHRRADATASHKPQKTAAPEPAPQDVEHRAKLLEAIGLDADETSAGTSTDMIEARRWSNDLGLTISDQADVVREVMATRARGDPPPSSFRFFSKAMTRRAGMNAEPPLKPQQPNERGKYDRRSDSEDQRLHAFLAGARSAS